MKEPFATSKLGFTLIEMLVVMAIMSIMLVAAAAVTGSMSSGNSAKQASYELKSVLDQARSVAMAENTYVWVGVVQETSAQGSTEIAITAVKGTTGQSSDLANGLVTPMMIPSFFPNIMLDPNVSITGMASSNNSIDISSSTIGSFTTNLSGTPQLFTANIQFSPQSEAQVQSNTLTPWITVGLTPAHGGTAENAAAVQVAGSTGEVSVF